MKNKGVLILGAIAIVGGYFYFQKKKQEEQEAESEAEEGSEEMSEFGGRRRRRKYDKAKIKVQSYCRRHPESPQCGGIKTSERKSGTSCQCANGMIGHCASGDCRKCCGDYGVKNKVRERRAVAQRSVFSI
jgi:hypothetical protein